MSFEKSLILYASPTLAGIKIANLYNYRFSSKMDCKQTLSTFNSIMNPKGIYLELLKHSADFYLIYVYRKTLLQINLKKETNNNFLQKYGYPIEDVKAFIEKKGKNCAICGEWKVYQDVENARCLFDKYKHCRESYMAEYENGRKFSDMLVSA